MTFVYTQQPNSSCAVGADRMTDCGENRKRGNNEEEEREDEQRTGEDVKERNERWRNGVEQISLEEEAAHKTPCLQL